MAKKGSIPWNKGLTKETDERVKGYSETKSKNQKGKPSKRAKYSLNPEDWVNVCVGCNKKQVYSNRGSYVNAMRMIAKKGEYKCCICSANYQCSEKTLKKKARKRFLDSLSQVERKYEISLFLSQRMREEYPNRDPEKIKEKHRKIKETRENMSKERKREWYSKVTKKLKENIINNKFQFRPKYNISTIPYIVDILNVRYNTEFIHAESEFGEFKIYDREFDKIYYADAYCPVLNIWIEFDEKGKFFNGGLRQVHIDRETRIRMFIPDVIINRIEFNDFIYNKE